jgi:UDP-N-acetyl-2-amino-2-deoxyglucuronate dehydrogenase
VSICSPNYLHDAHMRFALRIGADAICEKPLVLNPWNLDALAELQAENGARVWNILQLRLHPSIIALKEKVAAEVAQNPDKMYDIDLTYLTPGPVVFCVLERGQEKSGGIATNIGIHFFDMLMWIFGPVKTNIVHKSEPDTAAGYFDLAHARVRWFLSVNADYLPKRPRTRACAPFAPSRWTGRRSSFPAGSRTCTP